MTPEENQRSIDSKLQGQVNLVLIGQHYLTEGGSITLTSGIIQDEFIPMGTSSALVNGAIGAFVASAALEIGRGIRINAVSPNALAGSWETYAPSFQGFLPVADEKFLLPMKNQFWYHDRTDLYCLLKPSLLKAVRRSKFFWRRFGLRNRLWVNIRHRLE